MDEIKSYIFGFLIADGSLLLYSRNRGRISIELNKKDSDIIYKIANFLPNSKIRFRKRNTNFKNNYETIILANFQKNVRDKFINAGFPISEKTNYATIPKEKFSESDFWRGVFDGDGSIGFTNNEEPFISLITASDSLKQELCDLLLTKFNIHKNVNRNKRDNVYNVTLKNEDAIKFCDFLYNNAQIFLQRKFDNYNAMKKWKRKKKKQTKNSWSKQEFDYIKSHYIEDSIIALNRTRSSIKAKLFRMKNKR